MAITKIVTGGARGSEHGNKYGSPGDQKQSLTDSADYSGEVKMSSYTESSFKSAYWRDGSRYYVYRPINPNEASIMANMMIRACNNIHIGYSQYYQTSGDESRQGIFKRGVDTTVDINCDCSSLGSYIISSAMSVNVNTDSSGMGSKLVSTGKFMNPFPVSDISFSTNPPYNGDVLIKAGHVEFVVSGNPREGKEDELVTSVSTYANVASSGLVWSGSEIINYRNQFGQYYVFLPRSEEPSSSDQFYNQQYGTSLNGSYAWGRFSEILQYNCDLCRNDPRKWYLYKEDGYNRGVAPSLGAVMCFTHIYDPDDPGMVSIVEKIESSKIYISQRNPKDGKFEYTEREKHDGSWDMDLDKDGIYEYVFQGFIYNPSVDTGSASASALQAFISCANNQIGDNGSFTEAYTGLVTKNVAWSAAFIAAVANQSGSVLNIIIPNTYSCSDIGRIGVVRHMGTWLDGPALGGKPVPKIGDIALFRTTNMDKANRYAADMAGIVADVSSNGSTVLGTNQGLTYSFTVIMGDCNGKVKSKNYTTASNSFSGLFRPNWEQVDGTTQSLNQYNRIEGLYTEGTTVEDAAVRDLKYVNLTDKGLEPSIKSTGLLLCAINYTGMLANLYSTFAEVSSSNATDSNLVVDLWTNSVKSAFQEQDSTNIAQSVSASVQGLVNLASLANVSASINSNSESSDSTVSIETGGSVRVVGTYGDKEETRILTLNNTVKMIYELLNEHIQNPAGTLGIMGNMVQISNLLVSYSDEETGECGLLGWADKATMGGQSKRGTYMKDFCLDYGDGSAWQFNLAGQIEYIFDELSIYPAYADCIDSIKRVSRDLAGAESATRLYLDCYDIGDSRLIGGTRELAEYGIRKAWTGGLWQLFIGGGLQV